MKAAVPTPPPCTQLCVGAAWRRLPDFGRQETANLLWALATARHRPPPEWLDALLSGPCMRHLADFTHQELVNVLWALATLRFCAVGGPNGCHSLCFRGRVCVARQRVWGVGVGQEPMRRCECTACFASAVDV